VNQPGDSALEKMSLHHIEFYVTDAMAKAGEYAWRYGFEAVATFGSLASGSDHFSVVLRQGEAVLVLTEPRSTDHPGHAFLEAHGDGVADIALRVPDVQEAFQEALERGAQPAPGSTRGGDVAVQAFGDVRHTLVSDTAVGGSQGLLLGSPVRRSADHVGIGIASIDHFAVCLEPGDLEATVAFYESVLGLRTVFEERIVVGSQAMLSKVVQDSSRSVTLTLIQPDPTAHPGQIDEFVKNHGGAGVQHIAFKTPDVVRTVSAMAERGVEFLDVPDAYYKMLGERLSLLTHSTDELRQQNILVDEDQDGQLFQIFTRSTHPRRTLFFEVIERLGAQTFGSGNIKALYEAVEAERLPVREFS
jgi:4-hydroxymandelate synthase